MNSHRKAVRSEGLECRMEIPNKSRSEEKQNIPGRKLPQQDSKGKETWCSRDGQVLPTAFGSQVLAVTDRTFLIFEWSHATGIQHRTGLCKLQVAYVTSYLCATYSGW